MDTHLRIPEHAKVLNSDSLSMTLIAVGQDVPNGRLKRMEERGVTTLVCTLREGRVDLKALLEMLGQRAYTSLLVEGGSTLLGSMIREKLVDKFYVFKAPIIFGGNDGIPMAAGPGPKTMDACLKLRNVKLRRFDDDILIRGYPEY